MNATHLSRCAFVGVLALALAASGVGLGPASGQKQDTSPKEPPKAKRAEIGKNVYLEVQGEKRRVIVNAYVCLRQ